MEDREIKDLVVSALVISLAFGIAMSQGIFSLVRNPVMLLPAFVLSLVTVSIAFIFHELGHRTLARHFGLYAEYRKWNQGLYLALLFSLFGFVFAAPGAVHIHPRADLWGRVKRISQKVNGLVSSFGPVTNIILALIFVILGILFPALNNIALFGIQLSFITYGVFINSWLALFNLIPFGPLDGRKVFGWRKDVWIVLLVIAIALMFFG